MSQRGRPRVDYVGRVFGVVTVMRRDGNRFWCRCECGSFRHFALQNLISSPPKGHSHCVVQYEMNFEEPAQ